MPRASLKPLRLAWPHIAVAVLCIPPVLRAATADRWSATERLAVVAACALAGIASSLLFVLRLVRASARRRQPHLCRACDYDLTGNVSGTCPECGTPRPHRQSTVNDPQSPP